MTTDKEIVEKTLTPTGADQSEAAAQGHVGLSLTFIPYSTPAGQTESQSLFAQDHLVPPEDPNELYKVYQLSSYAEPCVDAVVTNLCKSPWKLIPVLPFDRPEVAKAEIRKMLLWKKAQGVASNSVEELLALEKLVTDAEVDETFEALRVRASLEECTLCNFFACAVPDMTFRQLRILTGQDYEITGNAYWELLRDESGSLLGMKWLPSVSMRCTPQSEVQVPVQTIVKARAWDLKRVSHLRRFRRYVQLQGGSVSNYFKEYGDPRILSRKSGKFYESLDKLQEAEGDERTGDVALPATEVLHFKLLFGKSGAYGKPRWSGNFVSMRGSRDLDEENQKVVTDENIPSIMLLVSGGVIAKNSYATIKEAIQKKAKGRKGIMLVEAVAANKGPVSPQQNPTIAVERFKKEQTSDMLFQKYDERNELKAASSWRIPFTALGKFTGANRSVADVAQRYVQDQVYAPLRADLNEPINAYLLPELGITLWAYDTEAIQPRDPQQRADILRILTESGILSPNEARQLAAPIFEKRLDDLEGLWAQLPPRVMTVLLQTKNAEIAAAMLGDDETVLSDVAKMIREKLGLDVGGPTTE
jgi:capsid portal protein